MRFVASSKWIFGLMKERRKGVEGKLPQEVRHVCVAKEKASKLGKLPRDGVTYQNVTSYRLAEGEQHERCVLTRIYPKATRIEPGSVLERGGGASITRSCNMLWLPPEMGSGYECTVCDYRLLSFSTEWGFKWFLFLIPRRDAAF